MPDKLRAILRQHRNTIIVYLIVIAILLLLFWAAHAAGKTLWEYLEILIIPLVIGAGAFWFQRTMAKRDEKNKEAARERAFEIESDRQHQAILATYLDRMSELLLKHNLRESEEGSEVRTVAKARTVSALRSLDGKRIAQVIHFLTESNLGGKKLLPRIELPGADLQKVDLRGADLQGAFLYGANLQKARLFMANLHGADLWGANLQGADLEGANLHGALLTKANLQGAHLNWANLQEADLRWALVVAKQLPIASKLKNAIMPDGTKYEEWVAKGKPDWSKEVAKQQADEPKENGSKSEDEA